MMIKPETFARAAQFAPRIFQVQRRTWIAIGLGLLVVFVLLIWAVIALVGWFFSQVQGWGASAPDAARSALDQVEQQVDQVVPGVRAQVEQQLGQFVPSLKAEERPQRDVTGIDLGPVARYPGLARTAWMREGKRAKVKYLGRAEYPAVLAYYASEFKALGYAQHVETATLESETHTYVSGTQRVIVTIDLKPKGLVMVDIEAKL
jgi:hypothetical protein